MNIASGRYQEDYPESYKKDAQLEDEIGQTLANASAHRMLQREQRLVVGERRPLTQHELDSEYSYIKARLFGETAGFELYDKKSDKFDQVYRDSVDEISEMWLEKYEDRFGREPPVGLAEYAYPMMGVKLEERIKMLQALDAEYRRISDDLKTNTEYLAIPKGLYRS